LSGSHGVEGINAGTTADRTHLAGRADRPWASAIAIVLTIATWLFDLHVWAVDALRTLWGWL
jgi:hypothetical protein